MSNVAQILGFVSEAVGNDVEKGGNAGYQNFLLFEAEVNAVEKGGNAGYQHFLHFPHHFSTVTSSPWIEETPDCSS